MATDTTRLEADFARDAKRILDDLATDLAPSSLRAWTSDERHKGQHAEQWATEALGHILDGGFHDAIDALGQSAIHLEWLAEQTGRTALRYLAIRLRGLEDRIAIMVEEMHGIDREFSDVN
jgi:hypothetical protein